MTILAVAATSLTSDSSSANTSVTVTLGDALIVGGNAYSGGASPGSWTVTRTGDTFTIDSEGVSSASLNRHRNGIASAPNASAGAVTLTISVTNAAAIDAWALEVSGPPSSGIRDANSPAVATGSSTTATANSLTNATAEAIFVTVMGSESSANPATVTDPAGYTSTVIATTMHRTNGAADQVGGMAFKIVAATGAETPAWTVSNAAWSAGIAVYKGSGSAAPTPQPPSMRPLRGIG